ncbi:hypothetical protein T492DRAFT_1131061 [Pavlovales sp. CCMP2436]|nr:hypothetical protein T492DRAFT_1131061 [Pavlovales sp. CCMP2436]
MSSVDALSRDRLMDNGSRDPRKKSTHYLLNGQPYDGAMHPIFKVGQIAPDYMTGPRHHAFSEPLVYSKRPVIIDSEPRLDLPRASRVRKTIFNAYRDAGVYDDMLNNTRGEAVLNRTIIPQRMAPMLNGRERPFNNTNSPFMAPRGAVSGGRGDQVFYSRVPPRTTQAPAVPDSSAQVPPGYMQQPAYTPTQAAEMAQDVQAAQMVPMAPGGSANLLAMVPRQVRREGRRFQVNPSLTIGPFMPPAPASTTRTFSGPALPPGFVRAPQADTMSSQSSQSAPQQPPRLTYTPPTPAGPSSPNFQSSSTTGGQAGQVAVAQPSTRREVGFNSPSKSTGGVNLRPIMKRQAEVERLGLNFSSAMYQMLWELSDQRRLPSKNDADAAAQRQRLVTYAPLLGPIQEQYGDLQSPRARAAISLVFGMHEQCSLIGSR